jgi:hypothetical protein
MIEDLEKIVENAIRSEFKDNESIEEIIKSKRYDFIPGVENPVALALVAYKMGFIDEIYLSEFETWYEAGDCMLAGDWKLIYNGIDIAIRIPVREEIEESNEPLKNYEVEIREYLALTKIIKANDRDEAFEIMKDEYDECKIVLDSDAFVSMEIEVLGEVKVVDKNKYFLNFFEEKYMKNWLYTTDFEGDFYYVNSRTKETLVINKNNIKKLIGDDVKTNQREIIEEVIDTYNFIYEEGKEGF